MTAPQFISSIADIAEDYGALLVDAWGVIHNGVELFHGVSNAMMRFRNAHGPAAILTNAPRPSSIIPAQLDRIGLPREAYDTVITSGDATRAAIMSFLPSPAYQLGPEKDDALYDGVDIDFTPLEEARFIVCTGLVDDQTETPEDYRDLLMRAAARRLPMVCANPDIVVRWGGRLVWCAGALAEIYQTLGGKVVYGGKPHAPIYDLAMKRLNAIAGADIPRSRVLAIGDGVNTDIAGANAQGIDALFIFGAGGVHEGSADAIAAAKALDEAGAQARYVANALKW
ncbi:MAG: TIGR01459 family HAD-type hydrolase [Parvularculaceae bacterium]